jgi:CBS domain containing-hemolysin-like protein
MSEWIHVAGALLLALLNGFFVAAEFALVKVRATRIEELANAGNRTAQLVRRELRSLDLYLAASQLGITLASLGLGWVGENLAERWVLTLGPHLALPGISVQTRALLVGVLAFSVITFLHVVIGEQAPKTAAIQRADRCSLLVAYPLHFFTQLFLWPIALLNVAARLFVRAVGLRPSSDEERAHSEEELRMILTASQQSGVLKDSELDLVQHVFAFADTQAEEIMVPRVDMVYLSTTWSMERVMAVVNAQGFTRFPLCNGDADHVIGMLHVKDLLALAGQDAPDLESIARPLLMVPESKSIDQLLREFQYRKLHMAIVLDEYGGTAGLVTLEDVLEEIVGEIQDEFEQPIPQLEQLAEGSYLVDGMALLDELREQIQLQLSPNGVDTLGGFVLETLGGIPKPGDHVEAGGYRIEVRQIEGQRIRKLHLTRLSTWEESSMPSASPGASS